MTLKGVHVLFIGLSILLAMFMAVWATLMYLSPAGTAGHLATALVSVAAAAALVLYAVRFVRRARRIGLD
jgi:hypothetical protein